jgi:aspartyl protease family protein
MKPALIAAAAALFACAAAVAQHAAPARRVTFNGTMGDKALLVIDGQPRTLAPGASHQGVKLLGYQNGDADVTIDGRRALLRIGAEQVSLGAAPRAGAGAQIVLTADLGGHFVTLGSINGRSVSLLVDTGASMVSMSQADAERLGVDHRKGRRGTVQTANGPVPATQVTLSQVRIGDVDVYNVDALVLPTAMPHILLGNSYLTRFQMRRENDRLTLDKRW